MVSRYKAQVKGRENLLDVTPVMATCPTEACRQNFNHKTSLNQS